MLDNYFQVYEYTSGTSLFDGIYEPTDRIKTEEIISYSFLDCDFPDVSTLEMQLKPLEKYKRYVPTTIEEQISNRPMIIEKIGIVEGKPVSLWFSFINKRQLIETRDLQTIRLDGVDFKYFDQNKIVPSNYGWSSLDPDNLPEQFKKVRYTGTLDSILTSLYNVTYINPNDIKNGGVVSSFPSRRFKGLNSYSALTGLAGSKEFNTEQGYLSEALERLFTLFDLQPVIRQKIVDNKIEITHNAPKEIDQQIVKKYREILERYNGLESKRTGFYGYGTAPIIYSVLDMESDGSIFTQMEQEEDFSFIAGSNIQYLINPTQTSYNNEIRDRFFKYHKIATREAFTIFNVGDIINIENVDYRIKKLQESKSSSTDNVDIDIEEV